MPLIQLSTPPIVIVDDDADDLFILKRLLTKSGIQNKTVAFEDATLAIDFLEVQAAKAGGPGVPGVIFTDCHMPGMNGLEFITALKAKPLLRHLPIVMVSSSENPDDMKKATALGAKFAAKYPTSKTLAHYVGEACGVSFSPAAE